MSRGRGRPRNPGTDRVILKAALELFIERGFEGTSIEQIAKQAGVGKLTVYRRWAGKEELLPHAIEELVAQAVPWPSDEEIAAASPSDLVEAALDAAAATASDSRFRALIARVLGSSVSNPALMAAYWKHYLLPRRELTKRLLGRAQEQGTVPADADLDVLIDMMAGAVMYRVLQPDPPDRTQMVRFLRHVYRQVGLLAT
ncbi:TetR/AcrR family transcriptional regulator [Actinopolymorpha pittospori]|uniref:AcrR family transcriptional regulator n=1 Tax=Actinopolymorpha pittospori TaxID=648752 RepID=A0A927MR17_9ACTN|nr:TetR/AcrR family transcriptional regulator [Actinopolymorpha pittospori]MBE1604766.1 AcrR family transcriptional regulator [Actinopolymorpha pittospori]